MNNKKMNGQQNVLFVTSFADKSKEQTIKCFNLPMTVTTNINATDGFIMVEFKKLNEKADWETLAVLPTHTTTLPSNLARLIEELDLERKVTETILSMMADYLREGVLRVDEHSESYNTFHLPAVGTRIVRMLDKIYGEQG